MSDVTINMEERADHKEVEVFIDGKPYHFKSRDVTGREIKEKAHVPDDHDLFLRHEGEEKLIRNDEKIELNDGEHFFSKNEHKEVEVFINEKPFRFESRNVTGREIKEKAHVPDNYSLYLRREGFNEPIADTEKVELHDGEHFFTRPPSNVS